NFEFRSQAPVDSSAKSSPIRFEVNKLTLKNTKLRYYNRARAQHINIDFVSNTMRLRNYTDGIEADLKGKIFVGGLMFNVKKGDFLKNCRAELSLNFTYFKDDRSICIHPPST